MEKKKIIGIPGGITTANGTRRYYINEADVRGIVKAGATPVMIPSEAINDLDYYVNICDGFFFTGGPDVLPVFYGEEPHINMGFSEVQRDRLEIALVKKALTADKKLLGICRGMQIINVALGGKLYQDLESEYPVRSKQPLIKHFQAASRTEATHYAKFTANSRLHDLYGDQRLINSHHHQAVSQVADSLKVTAVASDGVIEGLESKDNQQVLAVQWHPEVLVATDEKMQLIFDEFVSGLIK
ncbi:MAG: gamma-glutamyl-gamma-aminobutyrate hydrolase family protein [Liquorilactobacillus ghanensis]|uniref:gamma-glutamyl-gamma-aminobutyrate hydrolase family protein n=1 Tax=Liquorilactobacillus ghanensis TaxID=399370 RepID=UPI0039EBD1DF